MTEQIEPEIQRLLHLPWTVVREVSPEGDVLLRVREVPSAVGTGASDEERIADMWESLSESLRALLHFGDPIPLPDGLGQSWPRLSPPVAPKSELYYASVQGTSTGASDALVG
jgi:hypothetical protein